MGQKEYWKESLIQYVLEHRDDLDFTKNFWKGCEPIENDIVQYHKFTSALRLLRAGWRTELVCAEVRVSKSTVQTWRRLTQMPKLVHYLRAFLQLGPTHDGQVWINTECSHGYGIPIGLFLTVPSRITGWNQVAAVIQQLPNINEEPLAQSRGYLLGFMLGVLMGDASKGKSRQGASHRHINVTLSKKYDTNVRIGDFTCVSAKSIGLRMHRVEDLPKPATKPNGFYMWVSQASPLIDWIYNVVLGLKDDELTTYDSVRADWMLLAPRDFRVGVINGIAESDGSVAIASQEVEFWVDPHRDLLKRILELEGLHAFYNRQALSLSKTQAIKSFGVPVFSAHLRTIRYQRHEIMATARTLDKEERVPIELREEILALSRKGLSTPDIVERIAESRKVLLSFEAAQRWARKARDNAETLMH